MKNGRNSGEVVVEASIVVTLVMLIITIMLYVGMVMYQQTVVSVMANQTASNIAQVYSNNIKDPFTGYIEPEKVYQSVTYGNMKTDAYMDVIEQKANLFARYRMKTSRILAEDGTSVQVEIVKKPNELLKSQIIVTIDAKYDIPLVGIMGVDGAVNFSASGRADCVDILEYINGVEAVGNPDESNVSFLPDSKNCTITFIPNRAVPAQSTSVTVLQGKSILSSNRYTHCTMPRDPVYGDFEFIGWVDERGNTFTAATSVEEDIVVYGSWRCTLTLNAEGGSVNGAGVTQIKAVLGNRVHIPNASRHQYHFQGWYTQRNGAGTRYLSNDTIITGNVTLYAHWTCAHPGTYETHRTGNVCTGGTIYYKCTQCHGDMPSGSYPGGSHRWTRRCNQAHYVNYFAGYGSGGCGSFHYYNESYLRLNRWGLPPMRHSSRPWMYCVVCEYCHQSKAAYWCGYHGSGRPVCAPSNGHSASSW